MKRKILTLSGLMLITLISCGEVQSEQEMVQEQIEIFEASHGDAIIDTLYLGETDTDGLFRDLNLDPNYEMVFLSVENTETLVSANPIIDNLCPDRPGSMNELTGGMEVRHSYFNKDSKINLKLLGWFGPSLQNKQVLVMTDFLQHKQVLCTDNKVRKYGVGVRMFLFVSQRNRKVSLELPKLAANVELNRAKATYELKTIGLVGDKILDALPKSGEFNVENYSNVIKAVDEIIRLAKDNTAGVVITPQVIPSE